MANESGKRISNADTAKMKKFLDAIKNPVSNFIPDDLQKIAKEFGSPIKKEMGGKVQKMNMGGQVMDTTKSMPVGMMDGGKVKKMNMGGVIPGRGGMFKGMK